MRYFDHNKERFVHLMRLTWDLAQLGVALAVQLHRRDKVVHFYFSGAEGFAGAGRAEKRGMGLHMGSRSWSVGGCVRRGCGYAGLGGGAVKERFLGEVVLPGVAYSVAVARHCVGEMLAAAGHRDVENVQLIISELITNALIHTASGLYGGVVTVDVVAVDAEIVRVEVTDDGADTVPRARVSSGDDCHGRGLWLVEQISLKWGVRLLGAGQRAVWAETFTGQAAPVCAGEDVTAQAAHSGRQLRR
ncbi:ATP-binding protein [Nonomuraea sp. NPDC026600]|uniref:ATP-binding protein n=1 Tax=Nonomuraea sp. NPDC026600 TaxID=3155363 RepID=UPI0033E1EBCE